MKCMSCEQDISPKFKHAIEANVCPFCGENITDGVLNELFKDLFGIIQQFEQYKPELQEWMKENINMVPIGSVESFANKRASIEVDSSSNEDDIEVDDDGNIVKKKTNVSKRVDNALRHSGTSIDKQREYKQLANRIISQESGVTANIESSDDDDNEVDREEIELSNAQKIAAQVAARVVPQKSSGNQLTEQDYLEKLKAQREAAMSKFGNNR